MRDKIGVPMLYGGALLLFLELGIFGYDGLLGWFLTTVGVLSILFSFKNPVEVLVQILLS